MSEVSPDPPQLAAELARLLRPGVTVAALESCPSLLSLPVVASKAASPSEADLAVAAEGLIREAAVHVDAGSHGPASTLLGLAPGTRRSLLTKRRKDAADLIPLNADHFRKHHEGRLIEAVAAELHAADSAWRRRHRRRTEPEQTPAQSRVGINWLERHQAYRRVWTPVSALRDDLIVLLDFLRRDADWPDVADRVMNQLWRFAQFSRELERFVADYGARPMSPGCACNWSGRPAKSLIRSSTSCLPKSGGRK